MGASARTLNNVDGANVRDYINDMMGVLQSRGGVFNLSLAYSVGTNALTIAAKQQGGSNADSDNPIVAAMRSATAGSGDFNVRSIVAALSLVVSSGSTLGHGNSDSRWTYVYLIDNGGAPELAVSSKYFGAQGIVSTTAEGGAGAADSATTMYSTTARSNVAFLCVGRFRGPQTVAGTWAAVPTSSEVSPFNHIGDVAQVDGSSNVTLAAGLALSAALDLSASGAGQISFPSTQNPSAGANVLDDYEEGTWTPNLSRSISGSTHTYVDRTGLYTKIGNIVVASFKINISATTGAGSGNNLVTNFPFASIGTDYGAVAPIGYNDVFTVTAVKTGYMLGGTATLGFIPTGLSQSNVSEAWANANAYCTGNLCYRTN